VAGTNGKGSVAAMVERGLRSSGFRTALYTSPHLLDLTERFIVGGSAVSRGELEAAADKVLGTVHRLTSSRALAVEPTFFEVTTAVGFELFRRARVDVAVLEVGMGGRFDATNVASPLAGAITTIDLDHEQFLGRTISRIAFEKAGVIKPGMRVVVGERKREAVEVLERACRDRNAEMVPAFEGTEALLERDNGSLALSLRTPLRDYGRLRLALRGRHQADNAVVAVRLLETLNAVGLKVEADAVKAAVTETVWPGRLDIRRDVRGRQVLLDGAHNPAGARVLASYLEEFHPGGLPVVFGVMADKDVAGTLQPLLRPAAPLVVTRPPVGRAMEPSLVEKVARKAGYKGNLVLEPDAGAAIEKAWAFSPFVCACGSIFLVGEVLNVMGLPAWSAPAG
jgi:dihydrofolate synthase/folylpolyglutamate synthase